jgi:hypothetical protein
LRRSPHQRSPIFAHPLVQASAKMRSRIRAAMAAEGACCAAHNLKEKCCFLEMF